MTSTRKPIIGVFDSGVGGLTVLRALLHHVPNAEYLYFGDTARLPYGSKSADTVAHYAVGAINYLQSLGAEFLVIACNTATALAFDEIRAAAKVDVIGVIEPGAESASAASRNRKVVVIGTEATVSSHAYRNALQARNVTVREKACPLFVPLVEEGWIDHPVTEQVARIYLDEAFSLDATSHTMRNDATSKEPDSTDLRSTDLRNNVLRQDEAHDADVLLLGCTHYPLINPLLRRIAPAHVIIVDSAESTAHEVARKLGVKLGAHSLAAHSPSTQPTAQRATAHNSTAHVRFFATDSAEKFKRMGTRFLGFPIEEVLHVDLKE